MTTPADRRLLCVVHDFPHPPDNGSSVRVLGLLGLCGRLGDVRVVVHPRDDTTAEDVEAVASIDGVTLLLGATPTIPKRSGPALWLKSVAGRRPPWFLMWTDERVRTALAQQLGWATHLVAMDDFAAEHLRGLRHRDDLRVIIDKHKVYAASGARGERSAASLSGRARRAALQRLVLAGERATMNCADAVVVTSDEEAERLRVHHGREPDAVIGSAIDPPAIRWEPGRRSRDVLWLGTVDSGPNRDGLLRVLDDLRARPAPPFRLRVVGKGVDAAVREAARGLDVDFTGYVPELGDAVSTCGAAIVPLWSGGGGRLKSATLLGWGMPVAATPAALEGLEPPAGACVVRDDVRSLVDAAASLLDDPAAAARGRRAADWIAEEVTWSSRLEPWRRVIDGER